MQTGNGNILGSNSAHAQPKKGGLRFLSTTHAHAHARLPKVFHQQLLGFARLIHAPWWWRSVITIWSLPPVRTGRSLPCRAPDSHRRRQCRFIPTKPSHTHSLHTWLTYKVFPGQSLLSSPGGLMYGSQMAGSYFKALKGG